MQLFSKCKAGDTYGRRQAAGTTMTTREQSTSQLALDRDVTEARDVLGWSLTRRRGNRWPGELLNLLGCAFAPFGFDSDGAHMSIRRFSLPHSESTATALPSPRRAAGEKAVLRGN